MHPRPLEPEIVVGPHVKVDTLPLPFSYVTGPYRRYWIKAIAEEMANLREHRVWRTQRLPKGARPIKGMFVFKWKPKQDGTLSKSKARFTMKGYSQQRGLHYEKTYASVAALMTVYLTSIIAVELDHSLPTPDRFEGSILDRSARTECRNVYRTASHSRSPCLTACGMGLRV